MKQKLKNMRALGVPLEGINKDQQAQCKLNLMLATRVHRYRIIINKAIMKMKKFLIMPKMKM